jgi:uncharacterized protein DUF3363
LGERGDVIKTMHRDMARTGLVRGAADLAIYNPTERDAGRVVARGLSDEFNDRHYLIVDGADGRVHYIDFGRADAAEPLAAGSISIEPRSTEPKASDRTVAEIAAAHGGRYSLDIHLNHDATATAAFAETHLRRLEAMRRAGVGVEREPDRTWIIAPDHLERAAAYERQQARINPVIVQTLSTLQAPPMAHRAGARSRGAGPCDLPRQHAGPVTAARARPGRCAALGLTRMPEWTAACHAVGAERRPLGSAGAGGSTC